MSARLKKYINGLRQELTNNQLIASLSNGDIQAPEWISIKEDTDAVYLIDNEAGGESFELGFYTLVWDPEEAERSRAIL